MCIRDRSNRASTGSSYFWNQYLMLPPTQPANTWFSVTCNGETWLMCYYNVSQVRVGAAVRAKTLLQSLYADTGLVQDSGFALAGLDGTIVYSSQPDLMACGTSLAGHIPASLIVESHTVPEVGTLLPVSYTHLDVYKRQTKVLYKNPASVSSS